MKLKYSVICLFASLYNFTASVIPHQDEALQSDLDDKKGNIYTRGKLRKEEGDQMESNVFSIILVFQDILFPTPTVECSS